MKRSRILYALCAVAATYVAVAGVIKNHAFQLKWSAGEARGDKADNKDILRLLREARVVSFNSWPVDEDEAKSLYYIVQAFDRDTNYDGPGVKLSIFDEAGAVIHEDYFGEVQNIYSSYALRKGSPQLVMEISEGGSASFLKMLDYQDGKVVDLMETAKPDNDFTVSAEVRPQLRTGVNPAVEPYQILLTEGVGLASPAEKHMSIFRYKGGAYRYVGRIPAQKVDDYIEKLMAESVSKREARTKP
jgi:hypothetical protein